MSFLQILWLALGIIFAVIVPLLPTLIPLAIPLVGVTLAGLLARQWIVHLIGYVLIGLAILMAYLFAWQRGWDAHKAKVDAANRAALATADDAEQRMRLCEGAGNRWDAGARECVRD